MTPSRLCRCRLRYSTAFPCGVDVDAHIKDILKAIAKFDHLRELSSSAQWGEEDKLDEAYKQFRYTASRHGAFTEALYTFEEAQLLGLNPEHFEVKRET